MNFPKQGSFCRGGNELQFPAMLLAGTIEEQVKLFPIKSRPVS